MVSLPSHVAISPRKGARPSPMAAASATAILQRASLMVQCADSIFQGRAEATPARLLAHARFPIGPRFRRLFPLLRQFKICGCNDRQLGGVFLVRADTRSG